MQAIVNEKKIELSKAQLTKAGKTIFNKVLQSFEELKHAKVSIKIEKGAA